MKKILFLFCMILMASCMRPSFKNTIIDEADELIITKVKYGGNSDIYCWYKVGTRDYNGILYINGSWFRDSIGKFKIHQKININVQ